MSLDTLVTKTMKEGLIMLGFSMFSIMKVMHDKNGKPNGITKAEAIEILQEKRRKEAEGKSQSTEAPEAVDEADKSNEQ
jgi:hypothetical protein